MSGAGERDANAEPSQAEVKFTVVIPTYNYAHLLPDALRSLAAQTLPDFELLIVDDGSTDNTEDVAKQLRAQFQDFRYLKKAHTGLADTRNVGVRNAHGTHIAFLDADDLWSPCYLETVRERFIKSLQADLALTNGLRIRDDGAVIRPVFPPEIEVSEGPVNSAKVLLFLCSHFLPSGMVFRKSLYDRVGPFDTRFDQGYCLGDDVDWLIRAFISGALCLPIRQKLFLYRIHGRNLTANPADFLEPWLRIYTERMSRGPLGSAYEGAARSFTRKYVLRLLANYPLAEGRSMLARTIETLRGDFILRCAYFSTYFGLTSVLKTLRWAKRMARKRRVAQQVDLTASTEIIFQSL